MRVGGYLTCTLNLRNLLHQVTVRPCPRQSEQVSQKKHLLCHGSSWRIPQTRFTCFFGGCLFLGTEPMSANHISKHLQPRHWTCERSLVHHIYSFDGVLVGPARNNPCPGKSCSRCRRNIVPEKKAKRPGSHGVWCVDFVKKSHQTLNLRLQIVPNKPRRWSSSTTFSFSAFPSFLAITIQPSVLFWHIMLHLWVMAKPTALTVITSRLSSIHSQSVHESSQPPVAVRHSPRWSEVANMHAGYVLHMPVQILHKCDCTGLHRHKYEVSSL